MFDIYHASFFVNTLTTSLGSIVAPLEISFATSSTVSYIAHKWSGVLDVCTGAHHAWGGKTGLMCCVLWIQALIWYETGTRPSFFTAKYSNMLSLTTSSSRSIICDVKLWKCYALESPRTLWFLAWSKSTCSKSNIVDCSLAVSNPPPCNCMASHSTSVVLWYKLVKQLTHPRHQTLTTSWKASNKSDFAKNWPNIQQVLLFQGTDTKLSRSRSL